MAGEPITLELLRSRLTDLEARQRAAGGAADRAFWQRVAGGMPSGPSQPTAQPIECPTAQPTARPAPVGHLDAAGYEAMTNDDAWIEATAARADRRAVGGDSADNGASCDDGSDGGCAARLLVLEAAAGYELTTRAERELVEAAQVLARQRGSLDVSLVTIVSEMVSRGIDAPGGLSFVDWLRGHDPSLTAGQAKAFVTVGAALTQPRWARLRLQRLLTGSVRAGLLPSPLPRACPTRSDPAKDPKDRCALPERARGWPLWVLP